MYYQKVLRLVMQFSTRDWSYGSQQVRSSCIMTVPQHLTWVFLDNYRVLYSSDMSLCNAWLYSKLKKPLKQLKVENAMSTGYTITHTSCLAAMESSSEV